MDDLFAPCRFTSIQGYPHDLPEKAFDISLVFQDNNAIIVNDHIKKFSLCMNKWCNFALYNHEDIKMRLFVLSLEDDVMDWFHDFPDNSFDSLQVIVIVFKNRYEDQIDQINPLRAIYDIKEDKSEMVCEFNKRFNDVIRGLSQDYKPIDKTLLSHYMDAFDTDTSYELRHGKLVDVRATQTLVEDLEKNIKESWKSEILEREVEEKTINQVKELTEITKSMQVEHKNQVIAMKNHLISMGESRENELQNNNDQSWLYCRPCESFHDESTCAIAKRIIDNGKVGTNNQINHFDDEKESDKHHIKELAQMIKAIEVNHYNEMSIMRA